LSRKFGQQKPIPLSHRVCPRATTRLLAGLMLSGILNGPEVQMD
jgi:hypothetical protein